MHQQKIVMDYIQQLNLQLSDVLHVSAEKYFQKQASQSEVVLISRIVGKINKRNTEQSRTIVVSSENIYNIEKKSIKRKISIHKVYAVTISNTSAEFILHIPSESDYRYKSQECRDIILYYLSIVLHLNNKDGLRVYIVDNEELQQYCLHQPTSDIAKQTVLHPKQKLQLIYPSKFQLQYINLLNLPIKPINRMQITTTQFVNEPLKFRVKLEDFQKHSIIAQGSLNKIFLVLDKTDKQKLYALKSVHSGIIDVDLMEFFLKNYQNEPFIEKLEFCIRQNELIHFFFQLVKGGDLYSHLKEVNYFTELQTKFIVAQVAIGLSSLHEKGIIYGDLKPENILIDERGYIQLTDFGYGKLRVFQNQDLKKNKDINFTVEYVSPEYLKCGDLTRMSDWYSFGILVYELIFGISPYYNHNQQVAIQMISKGELHFPKGTAISFECKDFISKLLQQDSSARLGFQQDFKEIQQHVWLRDVNWQELIEKRKELPYSPNIPDGTQISDQYFVIDKLCDEEKAWF